MLIAIPKTFKKRLAIDTLADKGRPRRNHLLSTAEPVQVAQFSRTKSIVTRRLACNQLLSDACSFGGTRWLTEALLTEREVSLRPFSQPG